MNKRILVAAALLLAMVYTSCNEKPPKEIPEIYYTLVDEFESGNYENVIELCTTSDIPKIYMGSWYHYILGLSIYYTSPALRTRAAISHLKTAQALNPSVYTTNYYLAKMYFEISEYKKALKYFKKAAELGDESGDIQDGINPELWEIRILQEQRKNGKAAELADGLDLGKGKMFGYMRDAFGGQEQIAALCVDEGLTDYMKEFLLEIYFVNMLEKLSPPQFIEICNSVLEQGLSDEIEIYFKIQKIYFYMCMNRISNSTALLQELNSIDTYEGSVYGEDDNSNVVTGTITIPSDTYILNHDSLFLKQLFKKYKCFYYLIKGNYLKVHTTTAGFYIDRHRPRKWTVSASENISNFYKEFSADPYFLFLKKHSGLNLDKVK